MSILRHFCAVILDFDGVIVDSETLQARAWETLARENGYENIRVTASRIAGRLDSEIARELFGASADIHPLIQRKVAIQIEMEQRGELRVIPGIADFLQTVSRTHKLAVCSNSHEEHILNVLRTQQLERFFSAVVGLGPHRRPKPAPDLYNLTLKRLGVSAQEACAIEDSEPGLIAARQAGLFTIQLVLDGTLPSREANVHVSSYSELVNEGELA